MEMWKWGRRREGGGRRGVGEVEELKYVKGC